ncbi:MAG TPA: PIG-L family deacetylase [Chthoniobacter sp.]|nr:PIG-L family deacetylase [Chthoniobacter sp.]
MPSALAIAAHPDDIEFVMAGTLLLLKEAGWEIHYLNLTDGDMGSTVMNAAQTARVRRKEAQAAAKLMGAKWHAAFCPDLGVFYTEKNIRRLCAVVRHVKPTVVLTHALADYMEDHMITARLAVTATFARGIPNYRSTPSRPTTLEPCVIYHAMPHGQRTPMRVPVKPEIYVDTAGVHPAKRDALACHESQKQWLDDTQGMNSYLATMDTFSRKLGKETRKFSHAEGWSRHLHFGFGAEADDPLRDVLGKKYLRNTQYP